MAKNGTPKSSRICLLQFTKVEWWQCEDTWTKYQHFLDMGAIGEPPDSTRIVNNFSDKLLI